MNITQNTNKMITDWSSFSIGENNTVNFVQPGSDAAALNRVLGNQVSVIRGALNASGQIFLVNPNGVIFNNTAQVDVGSLVSSTLNISNDDFLAGNYQFSGNSSNAIINQGNIQATDGGSIAMIGAQIINDGTLAANNGNVLMGAGSKVLLDLGGPVKIKVNQGAVDTLIDQGGAIKANGGQICLTAKAVDDLASSVINHDGVSRAQTLEKGDDGSIALKGDMDNGTTEVAGTLDASAPEGGDGGSIKTSAAEVNIDPEATITTDAPQGEAGQWLIDPYDFTIADSGGDITGDQLGTALDSNDVTIETTDSGVNCTNADGNCGSGDSGGNGDIFVNDTVTWDTNTLTLSAHRNIEINQEMTATSGGGLALKYGQGATDGVIDGTEADYTVNAPVNLPSDGSFSTQLGSNSANEVTYTIINELGSEGSTSGTDLQGIEENLDGNYVLGSDIDASDTSNWDGGFLPLAQELSEPWFTGTLDGLGHTINNLNIERSNEANVGLFGFIGEGGDVKNLGIEGGSISGGDNVGALAGISGDSGDDDKGTDNLASGGTVTNVYATADVSGEDSVGGLVGENFDGAIKEAYATGTVSVEDKGQNVGGLVGYNAGQITDAYATGDVSASDSTNVGGLVGANFGADNLDDDIIKRAYATGSVTGDSEVGGLVGYNSVTDSTIKVAYATGAVSGNTNVGGFVGENQGTITDGYWDEGTTDQTSGIDTDGGTTNNLSGLTTDEAIVEGNYGEFDFTNHWYMVDGATRPFLRTEHSPTIRNAHQLQLMAMDKSADYELAWDIDLNPALTNKADMWATDASDLSNIDGAGFAPVGDDSNGFIGTFDGLGHTVSNLTIDRPTEDNTGLFGVTDSEASLASIRNVVLESANVTGRVALGTLVGSNDGEVIGVTVAGNVTQENGDVDSDDGAGGLVGKNSGTINESSSDVAVQGGDWRVGGLVGYNDPEGAIQNALATGDVTQNTDSTEDLGDGGGLVGFNDGFIHNSHATGNVTGESKNKFGGLAGRNDGKITASYASGDVTGQDSANKVGGLVGYNGEDNSGTIINSYATGAVSGDSDHVGGLVGYNPSASEVEDSVGGQIENAYATGEVQGGGSNVGGLVGYNGGSITAAYWDTETTGQTVGIGTDDNSQSGNVTGLTTAEMQDPFQFIDGGWDFADVWGKSRDGNNSGYMVLKALDDTAYDYYVRLSDTNTSKTYGATDRTLDSVSLDGPGSGNVTLKFNNTKDTGTYTYDEPGVLDPDFTTGTEGDYYFKYGSGALTIDPRTLTVNGDIAAADKAFDGTLAATITEDNLALARTVSGDEVGLNPAAAFTATGPGGAIPVELVPASALLGADTENYRLDLTGAPTTTASITGKPSGTQQDEELNASVSDASRLAAADLDGQDFEVSNEGMGMQSGSAAEEDDNQKEEAAEQGTSTRWAGRGVLTNVEVIATGIRLPEFADQGAQ